ncbi:16S rRNA (cytidine(1402)-2'-O)-methyltransferase [Fervidobacterium thailandense]|uniref:Ribosomal RNA small subunit methyltransferase I n=1 Tax=Fervidobacterium thailandense TaxID=1008305 RepID=A0A1E3G3A7_9BACT|nr:16S rRNA (cytidine(1402)-2'-O)-methyltransferase [Fervidobacterium thailandense]ODN30168.1 rRNA (cytidine-2'-O-)-methyltransferase [Fervidobacterium thailandense]
MEERLETTRNFAEPGTFYIVGTPIGNLMDVTIRALKILRTVDVVLAEDTRRTSKLLKSYNIDAKLMTFNEHASEKKIEEIIEILKSGKSVAQVSDAGMPVISDPGARLVRRCREEGIKVQVIPGPSALTSAVAACGLSGTHFYFIGFMPRDKKRRRLLRKLKDCELVKTVVFFESPERLRKTLEDVLQILGDVQICVARELTKLHEEVFCGTVSEALTHFKEPLGEITVVLRIERGSSDVED